MLRNRGLALLAQRVRVRRVSFILGALVITSVLAGTAIGANAQTSPTQPRPDTITVTGSATVSLPPDLAAVQGSVQTQADTAAAAADQNNQTLQAVINAVEALGITPDNIVTTGFSVQPQYSYTQPEQGQPSVPPTVVGYQATSGVTVTTKDLTQLSGILQAMAAAGATNLSGPSYRLQHPEQLQVQAQHDASADALQKAQAIASGLGVQLGDVLSVNQGAANFPVPTVLAAPPPLPPPVPAARPAVAPPPVLPPSSLSTSASVTVVFTIINASGNSSSPGP